jgi:tRNA A37 threonylcarbamoyladenosine dehydratase
MDERFNRTIGLIGEDNFNKLKNAKVIVFGAGGVGGHVIETLVRSGVGRVDVVDGDKVDITNVNRQIIALSSSVGRNKTDVVKERAMDINPDIEMRTFSLFYLPENADSIDLSEYNYVVDAIDTVTANIELIERCNREKIKIISCMGTGGKLNPTKLVVTDIYKTQNCPLARVMRRELKKRQVQNLKVVYSLEEPTGSLLETENAVKKAPPSMMFVPATAGLIIASEVVKDLIK